LRFPAGSGPVLLTGFEPFGGWPRNPSADAALTAAARLRGRGALALARVLPVELARAPDLLRSLVAEHRPRAVVCAGLHGRATVVRVERRAANEARFAIPDNAGRCADGEPLELGAGDRAVEVDGLVACLAAGGVPATGSDDAGRYLCNAVFFAALGLGLPAAFLHLPPPPGLRPDGATEHGAATEGDLAPDLLARAMVLAAGYLCVP